MFFRLRVRVREFQSGMFQRFGVRIVIPSTLSASLRQVLRGVQDRWNDKTHSEPSNPKSLKLFHSDSEAENQPPKLCCGLCQASTPLF